jgi:ABC-type Na+ efflux pump permease subunit
MRRSFIYRIVTIARNTMTEALRDRVLSLVLVFALVILVSSVLFLQFSFEEQFKFLKDFSLGAITLFGTLIAILGVAQLLPAELDSRTIYTILAKPVRRWEFLTGKFCGILGLLFVAMSLMSLVFMVVLFVEGRIFAAREAADTTSTPEQVQIQVALVWQQVQDPRLTQALLLAFAKVAVIAALALVISTFATSTIFTVVTTILLVIIGHLQGTAREVWLQGGAEQNWVLKIFLGILALLFPDFSAFSVIDDIVAGNPVPWSHTEFLLSYSLIYISVLAMISMLIFQDREL